MMRLLRIAMLLPALAAGVVAVVRFLQSPQGDPAVVPSAEGHNAPAGRAGRQHRVFKIAALLAVLAVGGFVVAASGIVPLKASAGHWPITAWFLHFAMRRSVATHTLGLEVPGARRTEAGAARCRPLRDRLSSLPRQSGTTPPQDCAADDPASAVPPAADLRVGA